MSGSDDLGGLGGLDGGGGDLGSSDDEDLDDFDDGFGDVAEDNIGDDELFDETVETASSAGAAETTGAASPDPVVRGSEVTETAEPEQVTQSQNVKEPTGKPYLGRVPDGITGDLVVIEWVEYLVGEVGSRGTSEAIRCYETVDWVTEDIADQLEVDLDEFEHGERGSLAIDHHGQSLEYTDQLNGGDATQNAAVFGGGGSL
jgi:archaellum component FlaD/FlaE